MKRVLDHSDPYKFAEDYIADLNKARLANKGQWITAINRVEGKLVEIKTFGTGYLQICRVDGLEHAAPMDMNVGRWKGFIVNAIQGDL